MARRNLLTREERERLFLPRTDHFSIIRNYTLTVEDLDIIGKRRGPVNRLGMLLTLPYCGILGLGCARTRTSPMLYSTTCLRSLASIRAHTVPMANVRKREPTTAQLPLITSVLGRSHARMLPTLLNLQPVQPCAVTAEKQLPDP